MITDLHLNIPGCSDRRMGIPMSKEPQLLEKKEDDTLWFRKRKAELIKFLETSLRIRNAG